MEFKVGEKVKVVKLSPEFNESPYKEFLGKSGVIFRKEYSSYECQNRYLVLFPSDNSLVGHKMMILRSFYEDEVAKCYPRSIEEWE